jgi:hypothetical protein
VNNLRGRERETGDVLICPKPSFLASFIVAAAASLQRAALSRKGTHSYIPNERDRLVTGKRHREILRVKIINIAHI